MAGLSIHSNNAQTSTATRFLASRPTLEICNLRENDQECHICIQPFMGAEGNELPLKLPCNHVMGSACLTTWLENNNTCPICRTVLFTLYQFPSSGGTLEALATLNMDFEILLRLSRSERERAIQLRTGRQPPESRAELSRINKRLRRIDAQIREVGERMEAIGQRWGSRRSG